MSIVVLGPQASPPARVQPNQEHCSEPLEEMELVLEEMDDYFQRFFVSGQSGSNGPYRFSH